MSQLLTQKCCSDAKPRPTALVGLLVVMAAMAVSIGIAGAQDSQVVFSDDFESGSFNPAWTEVENFEVISDPTLDRPVFVASVIDLSQDIPAHMVKDHLSLGPGTIARVFFYDDGAQDGDDHSAGLDGDLGSIGILARFSEEGPPSSEIYYIFDPGGTTVTTDIERTVGWHEFRFEITPDGASAFIDGAPVGTVSEIIAAEIFFIASQGGGVAYWDDVAIPPILEVPLDVKPQSCPNPLHVKSGGVLPVAILGLGDIEVTTIDPASIRLEGIAPIRNAMEDVATPFVPVTGKEDVLDCTDEGPDGVMDLTLKFKKAEIVEAIGNVEDGNVLVLTLTGNLKEEFGGTPIQGEDVVIILKKGKQ